MKKPPPKKMGGSQAKCPRSSGQAAPVKPHKQAGATKSNKTVKRTSSLLKRNWRVIKDIWSTAYHDLMFVGNSALWITIKHHDELIQIILLLVIMFLEYRLHARFLLPHN